jgi:hypothetical protein
VKIIGVIRYFTVDQWAIIDAEYRDPKAKTDAKGISSLILMMLILTINRYFGRSTTFRVMAGNAIYSLPFPHIWAYLYARISSSFLYLVIPALFIYIILHERLSDHGLTLKGIGRYKWIYIAMIMVVIPMVFVASRSSSFMEKYPLYPNAGNSWSEFLIWELTYCFYFLTLEFFFRGFMLFSMARYIGAYAIFAMDIPYVMIHFGKPFAETLGSVFAGIALGSLSLRTRSVFGGFLVHAVIAISMDVLAIVSEKNLQIF